MDPRIQLWRYEWLANGYAESTFSGMLLELNAFARWLPGDLESATRGDCVEFISNASSPTRAAWRWRALRSFYATLEGRSPMDGVKSPRVPEPPTQGVSEDTYKALLAVCGTTATDRRDAAIIATLWSTGLRVGELVALDTSDVDHDARHVIVRKSKTGRPRVVPLSSEAHRFVLRWLTVRNRWKHGHLPALWIAPKGRLTANGVGQMLRERRKVANTPTVTAHGFRRSFAVRWLSSGGSQASLKVLAGWSGDQMVSKYSRWAASEMATAEFRRIFDKGAK